MTARSLLAVLPLAAAIAFCSVTTACKNSEAAATTGQKAGPVSEGKSGPGKSAADEEAYTVKLTAAGPYTANKEGAAEIVLTAKPGFHVNAEFPLKFTPEGGDGIDMKPVGKDGAVVTPENATVKLPFTPTRTGNVKVAGKLSFSVCSDKNCLMEKQNLEVAAKVD